MREEDPDSSSFSGGGEGERGACSKGEMFLGGDSTTLHPGTSMSGDFDTLAGAG